FVTKNSGTFLRQRRKNRNRNARPMRVSLLLIAAMLLGCRTWDANHTTVLSPSGQKLCAKHHVPLITVRAYGTPEYRDRVVLVDDNSLLYHGVALSRVPNPSAWASRYVQSEFCGILSRSRTVRFARRSSATFFAFQISALPSNT